MEQAGNVMLEPHPEGGNCSKHPRKHALQRGWQVMAAVLLCCITGRRCLLDTALILKPDIKQAKLSEGACETLSKQKRRDSIGDPP